MKWRKLGRVYTPDGKFPWARSYAHLPAVEVPEAGPLRVYFASLDEKRRGRIGWVDVARDDPTRVVGAASEPVLGLGARGCFDDSGVNPSCIVRNRLYYIGWQRSERVPYLLFSGLARKNDDGTFTRASRAPILDRTDAEPFLRSAPCVLHDDARYRAWYVSGSGWTRVGERDVPTYVIRHAEGPDGIRFKTVGPICIAAEEGDEDEFGFGRPWVVRDGEEYHMWYSIRCRSRPYRIGYATSPDGFEWQRRDDEVGLVASKSDWDSEMICYPCVVNVEDRRYLFYNGNRHGESGFGVAILDG